MARRSVESDYYTHGVVVSDFSIPGIRSNLNTSETIEALVEAERTPITRMERSVETYRSEQTAWQQVARNITSVRDAARRLYGFENPFNERVGTSADESILTAVATREATEGSDFITVRRRAAADRFLSQSVARDYSVAEGTYTLGNGEQRRSFRFVGGTLRQFAQAVNDRVGGLVRASVVNDTPTTQVLLLEGAEVGSENRLRIEDSAVDLAVDVGMIARNERANSPIPIAPLPWEQPVDRSVVSWADDTLTVGPRGEVSLPTGVSFLMEPQMALEFDVRVLHNPPPPYEPPPTPTGPEIPPPPSISFEGIEIENAPTPLTLPPWTPPEPPTEEENPEFLYLRSGGSSISIGAIDDGEEWRTMTVPVGELVRRFDAIGVRNENSHRTIEIRGARVFDPTARGEYVPLNAISTASDAELEYNGITIRRTSNTVDDLIPGVTLQLRSTSETPVEVTVTPDRESAKTAIIEFVGHYNALVRDLNILTRTSSDIIDEIDFYDAEEEERAREQLGMLQGDSTLSRLRSRLQTILMEAYPLGEVGEIGLLAQIGVSTNPAGSGGLDRSRLRGYLDINEATLDDALENRFAQVRALFGHDSDGDLAVDTGVAYQVETDLRPYVQIGGIIAGRTDGITSRISSTEDRIDTYNARLEDYEQDLRVQYAEMEAAMDSLNSTTQALENLSTQSGGRQ